MNVMINPKRSIAEPLIKRSPILALDIETKGLDFLRDEIVMLIVYTDKGQGFNWDTRGGKWPDWINFYLDSEEYIKIVQEAMFDGCFIQWQKSTRIRNIRDTALQEQIINGIHIQRKTKDEEFKARWSSSLKYQLDRYKLPRKREELIPMPDGTFSPPAKSFAKWPDSKPFHPLQIKYGNADVAPLHALHKLHRIRLKEEGLQRVAELENEVVESFIQMRVNGIGFDQDIWFEIADNFNNARQVEHKKLLKLDSKLNWNAPAQVKKFFANRGIFIKTFKDLGRRYSKFKGIDKDLDTFIRYRSLFSCANTFGRKWLRGKYDDPKKHRRSVIGPDGRVHCDFTQIISTGRSSCNDPNLQQLPNYKAKESGVDVHRRAFVPTKGSKMVIADFSGQEFALMMFMAGEKEWLNHIRKRHDVHSLMTSKALAEAWKEGEEKGCEFRKSLQKCKCFEHLQMRDSTKKTTFGIAYGKGAGETAEDIGKDVKFAKRLINAIYREAPKLKQMLVRSGTVGLRTRETRTPMPFNRLRRLVEKAKSWHIKNQAINSPIQGAGGDMLKQAMVYLQREIDRTWHKYGAKLLLVIHDELVTEVKEQYARRWSEVVVDCMERAGAVITNGERLITAEPVIQDNMLK